MSEISKYLIQYVIILLKLIIPGYANKQALNLNLNFFQFSITHI